LGSSKSGVRRGPGNARFRRAAVYIAATPNPDLRIYFLRPTWSYRMAFVIARLMSLFFRLCLAVHGMEFTVSQGLYERHRRTQNHRHSLQSLQKLRITAYVAYGGIDDPVVLKVYAVWHCLTAFLSRRPFVHEHSFYHLASVINFLPFIKFSDSCVLMAKARVVALPNFFFQAGGGQSNSKSRTK
jgi:hypothetical protein